LAGDLVRPFDVLHVVEQAGEKEGNIAIRTGRRFGPDAGAGAA